MTRFSGILAGVVLIAITPSLSGCGSMGGLSSVAKLNPFKKEEVKLAGERTAVMTDPDSGATEAIAAKGPVSLPPAQNNASWRQPGGTAANAPGHLALGGELNPVWKSDAGTGSSSDGRPTAVPVMDDGKVYTLDAAGNVMAFSATSGGRVWRVNLTPKNEKGYEGFGGGVALGDGRIFVTTGYGTVVALNSGSGEVLWEKKTGDPIRTSPTAAGGKVFFVSSDSVLHCLNAADGSEAWTARGLPQQASLLNSVSPAVAGNTVVVPFASGDIVAYKIANGEPAWQDSLTRSGGGGSSLASLSDPARPAIDRGIVFAVSHAGRMIAASESTGERLWTKSVTGTQMPWVAGDTVYVVDVNGKLMALTRGDGKARWISDLPRSSRWSGPVLGGGKLWLVSAEGLLIGVDATTGQVATQTDLDTPVFIAPIVASGRMYVFTDKARLIALN